MSHNTESSNFNLILKYWKKKISNKEGLIVQKKETVYLSHVTIKTQDLSYFNKITNKNSIAQYAVINAIYSFLLKRLISEFDGCIASNFKDQNNSLLQIYPTDLKISFKEYLQKVKEELLETLNYSDYNNEIIKEKISFNDFTNYNININSDSKLGCNGVSFYVEINENEDIEIHVSYLEGFVKKTIVEYLIQHFQHFIINLESNIASNLSEYPLLSEKDKYQLLVDFNDTDVAYPKDKTIIDLFEEQVENTPNNTAVVFGESKLTYKELNKKANQLANYISSKHTINNGDIIGVFLPKSDIGVISLLAILKLGAVYLPIDTNYPQERIDYLINDSGLKLLISDNTTLDIDNCDSVVINTINFEGNSSDNINAAISSKDLAYVIYTSGSTGQPKGVLIEHTSNVNMSLDQIRSFEITESDKVVWFASVAFDASISEIMMSLYSGATLCIPTEDIIKDKEQFVSFLKETRSTVVTFPPSYLGLLSENDISGLRCVITAGESANPSKAITVVESGIDYYNAYGPTECAVCVSIYKVTKNDFDKSIIPIGRPISNSQVYILDEALQPLPIGVSGQVYVSGAGVARGYLNKSELTIEKFVANPFIEGERLYDTGDLGCWLSDGNIEFLGRKDSQVKIRGYRIELGEIENTISQYSDDLKQVVVEVKENNQEKILIAYFVSTSIIDKSNLRDFLQRNLPDYMLPSFYVVLEKLPLTPNGKIDRKALPSTTDDDIIRKEYVAPRNKTEEILVSIWQEVLGIEKIGITDNFFELGGHSLIVSQVINRSHKQLGQTVSFKVFFASPTIEDLSTRLQENQYTSISKALESTSYPLTASQSRLWILSQLEGGSLAYNMPAAVKLTGIIDVNKFEESFQLLIQRHEVLRTYFKTNEEGEVRQYVVPTSQVTFKIEEKDFSLVEKQEEEITDYLQERNNKPFDLEQTPLVRASLIKLKEEEYVFFLSLHHIIGDGWSIEILISEVVKTYNALTQGNEINLPELSIQYKDYAVWLNEELQHEKHQVSEQYWLQQFEGELPVLDLPSFKTHPLVQTYNGENVTHLFSRAFLDKLKAFSKEQDVTLFMTLMAGINFLLHRYTGQDDIIIGTPVAGREHPDLENQMGLYLNTLAIRTQLQEGSSFLDLVAVQKETLLGAYDHQSYPFDVLVGKLNLKRDTGRSALFDVLVVLQNQEQLKNLNTEELSNIEISDYDFKNKTAQLDISFTFVETDGLDLTIEYNTDIYDGYLIERMFLHFEKLLTESLEQPERLIQDVDYLTDKEKQQLLFEFNNTEVIYSKDKTIVDLFQEQVEKTPNNIAVIFEEIELTYKELNEKANQLAYYLRENYSIQPDDLVGIKLDRSEMMIIAILGILKSGAAYVPIDINYPQERIAYIEKDSNCKVVIDEVALERFNGNQGNYSKRNIEKNNQAHNLAYVIYTSGTTGNPKGVMVEHSSLIDYVITFLNYFQVKESDSILSQSTISFDTSIEEIFPVLNVGGKLIIVEDNKDFNSVFSLCEKHKITLLSTNPFMIDFLNSNPKHNLFSLKKIISGGDVLKSDYINKICDKVAIYNSYGPTETTVCATYYGINKFSDTIPIGSPISNTQIYILDEEKLLAPIGIPGKIYISGKGVARGYLNKPELTSEKFIVNPFSIGERMYDTGDLGCWLPDGNIEFLGRKDNQVNIRGYRIELGEIENKILQYSEDVKQTVVEVKEYNQEKVLIAYLVPATEIDKSELRVFLQKVLPDYMIPSFYVVLEELPLTSNGKINRKALPNISDEHIIKKEYVAPRNETEEVLRDIWTEILGVEKIGITDNFFDLGGHSLMIAQIINRVYKQLNKTIPFKVFFTSPTIEGLSKELQNDNYIAIPKASVANSYPLTAAQSRLWILSQLRDGSLAYNMPGAIKLTGTVDKHKLEESFRLLITRHEILRTYFKTNAEEEIRQYITPVEHVNFRIFEKDYSLVENQEEVVANYLQEKNNEPFILEQAPLLRNSLIKLGENEHLFFLTMHHMIGDGWSMELLIAEIIQTYNALTQGKQVNLPELTIQYKDYAVWLNDELQQEKLKSSEQYWLQQFEGELPVFDLPSFKTRPLVQTYNGDSLVGQFSKEFLDRLKSFSKENDVTLFMTLMAGINALLYRYTGQNDIILGTPIAGREHPDLENQLGMYLNTLAIRTHIRENNSFLDLVLSQKEVLLGAYKHQSYPFDELVKKLNLKKDTSRSTLFDVMVVLQNQEQLKNINNEEIIGLEVHDYSFIRKTSQSDIRFAFTEKEGLELMIDYNTDIYDAYLIERMFLHFENLMNELLDKTEKDIQEVEFLTEVEKLQVVCEFNNTVVSYPKDKTIVALFEEQVANTPDNIAVVFDNVVLTYKELNEKVNQLAHYLRDEYYIEPNNLVGIKLDRSEQMIIAILSVLKSGAAYVPIDTNYPQERIAYIEKDINCKVIIDEDELSLFNLQRFRFSGKNQELINSVSDIAYIIYTSGSTGEPKGVMVEHRNVVRLVKPCTYFPLNIENILLSTGSVSFDATTIEYFGTLLNGSRLILTTQNNLLDSSKLEDIIKTNQVNSIWMTASWFNQVVENNIKVFETISQLIVGGDIVSPSHTKKVFESNPAIKIVNGYGPTENTTFSATFEIQNSEYTTIPIGKPIPNSYAYILNNKLQPVATGVIGQLYVSGAGVARGYLNKAELTAEKFITNPFLQGERLYDTGDLCKWLPDGNIEFLGRKDQQVKIRGFRIELGEIENAILQYSANLNQVVVEVKEMYQEKVLIAYLVSSTDLDKNELRLYLQSKLPDYMIPGFYIVLDKLPLTSNGKINRKELPSISDEDFIRKEYVGPRNETEEKLVGLWQEVLGVEKIGITDNFFELGGDSIRSIRLLSRTNKLLEVNYKLSDIYELPSILELLSIRLERLESEISPLIKEQVAVRFANLSEELKSELDIVSIYPMSDIELGMLYTSFLDNSEGIYHDQFLYPIPMLDFDASVFRQAVELLVGKHEILRTAFNLEDYSVPVHLVYKTILLDLEMDDISGLDKAEQESAIKEFMLKERTENPFALSNPGLWNMKVYKMDAQQRYLLFQFHHAILDGWSAASFITELNNTYVRLLEDSELRLEKLSLSYKDYVFNQNCIKSSENQFKYWEDKLNDYKRLDIFTEEIISNRCEYIIEGSLHDFIQEFIAEHGISMKIVNFSAYLYTLQMLTYDNDVTAGIVTNGRPLSEDGDKLLGCFLNTVPFRLGETKGTILEFVKQINHSINIQKQFEGISLFELHTRFSNNSRGENPFFDTLFNYIDFHIYNELNFQEIHGDEESQFLNANFEATNTFLDLTICPVKDGVEISWHLQRELKGGITVGQLQGYYHNFLDLLVSHPDSLLNKGAILSLEEKTGLLENFNAAQIDYFQDKTIATLFEDQVVQTPDNTAVVFGETELTYGELNAKANQLAWYLREMYNIEPNDLIGIKLDRSEQMIIVILAILKSGAAYVPIDINYPQERIAYIEKDIDSKIIIDQTLLNRYYEVQENNPKTNIGKVNQSSDLAYVIYTSGTTGNPKGVMVEHRNVISISENWKKHYNLEEISVNLLQLASISFDVFVGDICRSILNGGKMIICPNDVKLNPENLYKLMERHEISILESTPGLLFPLVDYIISTNKEYDFLKILIFGSDNFNNQDYNLLKDKLGKNIRIINSYGVTEATIDSTYYDDYKKELKGFTPIGKPFSNIQIYILDTTLQPLPIGAVGTIYIAGTGVSRGYLNQPELTSEKFIPNPFIEGTRMYNTGDLGHWLADGNISFLGRNDFQVKIRGFRIELGEIEHTVLQYSEALKQVIVEPKEMNGEKVLVVYLVSDKEINKSELKDFLQERLPDYMIPGFYVDLNELPLTPNGKINRKALPNISGNDVLRKEYVAPRNEIEEKLAFIWQDVLGLEKIGITDNFFELGGHSLTATRLISLINKEFEVKISINDLFKYMLLEEQAVLIKNIFSAYSIIEMEQDENDIEFERFSL